VVDKIQTVAPGAIIKNKRFGAVSLSRQDRETTEICHSAAPNLG
jgi:hypothetical protein